MKSPTVGDRDLVAAMLRQFRAAQETLLRGEGGDRDAPWSMPLTWTPEMRELERCLNVLAYRRPVLHRQVMSRYVDPVLSRRTMKGRVSRRGAVEVTAWPDLGACAEVRSFAKLPEHGSTNQYTCLVASWPGWVNKSLVELAVDFLVREFRSPSAVGPALPAEMIAA